MSNHERSLEISTLLDSYYSAYTSPEKDPPLIKRAFNLGLKKKMIQFEDMPAIEMLPEDNVRQGFFEYAEFVALRDASPDWFKHMVTEIEIGISHGHQLVDRAVGIIAFSYAKAAAV